MQVGARGWILLLSTHCRGLLSRCPALERLDVSFAPVADMRSLTQPQLQIICRGSVLTPSRLRALPPAVRYMAERVVAS